VRRLALLASALLIPLLPAAPAYAAAHVICVGSPAGSCDQTAASIGAAITIADSNGQSDVILVGPGTYTDGPYNLDGSSNGLVLQGSGEGLTFLTLAANPLSQDYVSVYKATVRDLTITLNATSSSNDHGIHLFDADAQHVTVDGTGTTNAEGVTISGLSHLEDSTIRLPLDTGGTGVYGDGGVVVQDSAITADYGYSHSGTGTPDTLSRLFITARTRGVVTDSGEVDIDDSVVDLGTADNANGLVAANFNNSTATKTINADHVTIVGGGTNSRGAWAYAQTATAQQHSDITLSNSIIRGPATSILVAAENDGAQGGNSTATVTTSYSDWSTFIVYNGPNGTAQLLGGTGDLDVDPLFVDPAADNYRLRAGSPVVDAGDPASGGPTTDLAGGVRVYDGDGDSTATRDMGAYERSDLVAPHVTVVGGPAGATADQTPTFSFTADESAVSYACAVDGGAFTTCSGPGTSHTTGPLGDGAHTFSARATDLFGNTSSTATRAFTVDTVAPDTRLTSKPAKRVTKRRVTFGFASTESGSTFRCKVDTRTWRSCASPYRFKVSVGIHRFRVRATDAAGNTDATPATFRFRRVR
jgi:hypothetical protein